MIFPLKIWRVTLGQKLMCAFTKILKPSTWTRLSSSLNKCKSIFWQIHQIAFFLSLDVFISKCRDSLSGSCEILVNYRPQQVSIQRIRSLTIAMRTSLHKAMSAILNLHLASAAPCYADAIWSGMVLKVLLWLLNRGYFQLSIASRYWPPCDKKLVEQMAVVVFSGCTGYCYTFDILGKGFPMNSLAIISYKPWQYFWTST